MKRRRVLGIAFLAGRRRVARTIHGAVKGWRKHVAAGAAASKGTRLIKPTG